MQSGLCTPRFPNVKGSCRSLQGAGTKAFIPSRSIDARALQSSAPYHAIRKSTMQRLQVSLNAVPGSGTSVGKSEVEKKSDALIGCSTIVTELKGLGFSRFEAKKYFMLSAKLPKGVAADFDINRARTCLDQMLDNDENGPTDALDDLEALQATQAMLSEIWRWKRRGGGSNEEDDNSPLHQQALKDIQSLEVEDIDRITSSLLDTLPFSDTQKNEMGGAVQQVALNGINGAVWGSLAVGLLCLVGFNFMRT